MNISSRFALVLIVALALAAAVRAQEAGEAVRDADREESAPVPECAIVGIELTRTPDGLTASVRYVTHEQSTPHRELGVPQFAPYYFEALSDATADGDRAVLASGELDIPGESTEDPAPDRTRPRLVELIVPLTPDPAAGPPRILRVYRSTDREPAVLCETPLTPRGSRE